MTLGDLTCSKDYTDIPFAHRQHNHDGHCAFIHGHNWGFSFTFGAHEVDENGFVIDFGKLKWLKEWINKNFDHALVLNHSDPYRDYLTTMLQSGPTLMLPASYTGSFAKILVVPDASCEGLAQWLYWHVNARLKEETNGRVVLMNVTVVEDSKNSASFSPSDVYEEQEEDDDAN